MRSFTADAKAVRSSPSLKNRLKSRCVLYLTSSPTVRPGGTCAQGRGEWRGVGEEGEEGGAEGEEGGEGGEGGESEVGGLGGGAVGVAIGVAIGAAWARSGPVDEYNS